MKSHYWNIGLMLIGSFILLFCLYPKVMMSPGKYLLSDQGDGISSYYNTIYHIQTDSSFLHFEGMNAPYGEHFNYSVHNPLLSFVFKTIAPQSKPSTIIAAINLSVLWAIPLSALFFFLIGSHYKVNPWVLTLLSISLAFGMPQLFRMNGHFSLAYPFIIPAFYYILLKLEKWRWYGYFGALFFLFSSFLIHAYWGILLLIIWMVFFLSQSIVKKSFKSFGKLFLGVITFILFMFLTKSTDHHIGRTKIPKGIWEYKSSWIALWTRPSELEGAVGFEGWAYMGVLVFTVAIASLSYLLWKRKASEFNVFIFILITISLLLGTAAIFEHLPWLLDEFPIFHQLRSIGRFMWLAHFSLVLSVIIFMGCVKKIWLTWILTILIALNVGIEFVPLHQDNNTKVVANTTLLDQHQQIYSEYEGMLYLPFYMKGSEHFAKKPSEDQLKKSIELSHKYQIPLVNSFLARSSIWECRNKLSWFSRINKSKNLKGFEKKKILVYADTNHINEIERELLSFAKPLSQNHFYELNVEDWNQLGLDEDTIEPVAFLKGDSFNIQKGYYHEVHNWNILDSGVYEVHVKAIQNEFDFTPNLWDGYFIVEKIVDGVPYWLDFKAPYEQLDIDQKGMLIKLKVELSYSNQVRLLYKSNESSGWLTYDYIHLIKK